MYAIDLLCNVCFNINIIFIFNFYIYYIKILYIIILYLLINKIGKLKSTEIMNYYFIHTQLTTNFKVKHGSILIVYYK